MVTVELCLQLRNNFCQSAGTSEELRSLPIGLYGHCQATYGQYQNRVYLFGGRDEKNRQNPKGYIYTNPDWSEIGIQFQFPKRKYVGCLGNVLIFKFLVSIVLQY